MNNIDSVLADTANITPERLAIMKLDSDANGDLFSSAGSRARSHHAHRASTGGQSLTRLRHSSTMSRQTSAFMATHRHKMALELTTQAESHFSSFMELIASASKEASSFKEYWAKLLAERESFEQEREQLLSRVEEVTDLYETQQRSEGDHSRELADRKRHFDKLVFELSGAVTSLRDEKQKTSDREIELEQAHKELSETRAGLTRVQQSHDTLRAETERISFKLTAADAERDRAKDDAEKYRTEFRAAKRESAELRTRVNELSAHLETTTKDKASHSERLRIAEKERDEYLFDRERLQEESRRASLKTEETSREILDIKERSEHMHRELSRLKEVLRSTEIDRDDHSQSVDRLRIDIKDKVAKLEETESRYTDILIKLEQSKREVATKQDTIINLESTILDVRNQLDARTEENRLAVIERDQLRDDLESHRRDAADHARQLSTLQDSLKRSEATIAELRAESFAANERTTLIERERDTIRHQSSSLSNEVASIKSRLALLTSELTAANEARDRAERELTEFKSSYEEVTETVSEWKDDSEALQTEIEYLRRMLIESRAQRERAVEARNSADRERDEVFGRWEEKCRELERIEGERVDVIRASGGGYSNGSHSHGLKRVERSRVFSQGSTGTTVKNGNGEFGDA